MLNLAPEAEEFETELPRGLLADGPLAKAFTLAGNATFTLVSKETTKRYTYRVRKNENLDGRSVEDLYFVSVMYGPDNTGDFVYMGTLRDNFFRTTLRSRVRGSDPRLKAFEWFVYHVLRRERMPARLEFWHEGRCGHCNRKLTDPESVARGLGPVCAGV